MTGAGREGSPAPLRKRCPQKLNCVTKRGESRPGRSEGEGVQVSMGMCANCAFLSPRVILFPGGTALGACSSFSSCGWHIPDGAGERGGRARHHLWVGGGEVGEGASPEGAAASATAGDRRQWPGSGVGSGIGQPQREAGSIQMTPRHSGAQRGPQEHVWGCGAHAHLKPAFDLQGREAEGYFIKSSCGQQRMSFSGTFTGPPPRVSG